MKKKSANYMGYVRKSQPAGARDFVAVIPTVGCVNEPVMKIANKFDDAVTFLHHQGCCQLSPDVEKVSQVISGIGSNPNVKSVLLVSLGCESVDSDKVRKEIEMDKRVEFVRLQDVGGLTETVSRGTEIVEELTADCDGERTETSVSDLTIGVKCGASDATSGIASNPATGAAVDKLVEEGATVIFGETTEILGAEHILARRAANEEVEEKIFEIVGDMEERVERFGVDMRGGQPTEGNIKGGLTTIEDKSLGAIVKSGNKPIKDVLEYGERPSGPGLYLMDSPGREMEFLTSIASAGSQVILFSTGLGAPQGFPVSPVIKISGNENTCESLSEHIDVDVSSIVSGQESIQEAGDRVYEEVVQVTSGKRVQAETLGYDEHGVNGNIYTKGPVI